MNRTDLIALISSEVKMRPDQVGVIMDKMVEAIYKAMEKDDSVTISKFGSFSCVKRKDREGHNPKTGEKIVIPSKRAVKFKPAKAFKEIVESIK